MNITRRPPQGLERQGRTGGYSYQRDWLLTHERTQPRGRWQARGELPRPAPPRGLPVSRARRAAGGPLDPAVRPGQRPHGHGHCGAHLAARSAAAACRLIEDVVSPLTWLWFVLSLWLSVGFTGFEERSVREPLLSPCGVDGEWCRVTFDESVVGSLALFDRQFFVSHGSRVTSRAFL